VRCGGQRHRADRGDWFRQAKVEQLGPGWRDHDVAGLEIAMDDPRSMRLLQGVGDLRAEL